MKRMNPINIFCTVALLGCATIATAQENLDPLSRQMTLEREYDPSVQDASKVNTLPVIKEPEVRKIPIDYATFTAPTSPAKEIRILPSGEVMTEIAYNKRRGYLNLAGGTYLNLNGDFGYHILSTEKDQLNLFFSHRSTNGKVKYLQEGMDEKVKAKINDNLGGINFKHRFDQLTFKLGANYKYSGFNYYGLPYGDYSSITSSYISPERETNQVMHIIKAHTGVESAEGAEVGYLLDINYALFNQTHGIAKDDNGLSEHSISATFDLNAGFAATQKIGLGGNLNYFARSGPDDLTYVYDELENFMTATITPYYGVEGDSWRVKLGANLMFITGNYSKVFVSPHISANIVAGEKTEIYLNAGGDVRANNSLALFEANRYIHPFAVAPASRTWLDGIVGVKSAVATGFWMDLFGGYTITDSDYFYGSTPGSGSNSFGNMALPFILDSKRFFGGAHLKYAYQQLFEIGVKGVYNNWTVEDESGYDDYKPFGRPEMELNGNITIRPVESVGLLVDYYLATGRYNRIEGKMKNINELNITGSYTFNDTFGAYIKLHNVLFQKYEYLYGYPMQGFSAMVGVNLNF
ncbi:TonB-dependent receptor [Parabacteroides sp. PF5-9]|uniref:TonB-dependent receptor n=1 Tax=Parabacteroides sp. PF5-9 TaxID=1742404 RepID=UPI0024749E14|nr:TonB-dependent receptor [Parabacteroides sp. PF5-9]MDH6359210.1 hypothetical protein [Parabacteroides sp. PF5-9]